MSDDDVFTITTWRDAEHYAAGHMRVLGFRDADVTPPGADGGIDVTATGGVGQVKHYANAPVGSPAVQQLLGATSATDTGVFYSLSGFTASAVKLAEEFGIALFSYTVAGEVTARSSRARALEEVGFSASDMSFASVLRDDLMTSLRLYGQRVVDTVPLISADVSKGLMKRITSLMEAGQEEEAREVYQTTTRELRNMEAFFAEFRGQEPRDPMTFLLALLRAEGWNRQLAERFGLDYAEAAAAARAGRTEV